MVKCVDMQSIPDYPTLLYLRKHLRALKNAALICDKLKHLE